MTDRRRSESPDPVNAGQDDPENQSGELREIGGSASGHWNRTLLLQAGGSVWTKHSSDKDQIRQANATYAALVGIAPQDELEAMMGAQLIAAHNAAMECYRRAMTSGQTPESRRENLNQANKLTRTWAMLLDALNKHRGKGQQKVTVEHVHVHAGGQAVVGAVERPGGGDQPKTEEQPHAEQIENASEPTLRREDAQRDPVPVPRDGERPLPNARREVPGRADRE